MHVTYIVSQLPSRRSAVNVLQDQDCIQCVCAVTQIGVLRCEEEVILQNLCCSEKSPGFRLTDSSSCHCCLRQAGLANFLLEC